MAKSSLETAVWDLYAKQQGQSLAALFGGLNLIFLLGQLLVPNLFQKL
jgi:hypothetical protein